MLAIYVDSPKTCKKIVRTLHVIYYYTEVIYSINSNLKY